MKRSLPNMSIKARGGMWWIRFQFRGDKYHQTTGLAATKENLTDAKQQEAAIREELLGARGKKRIRREFTQASASFLIWNDQEVKSPATAKRNRTSFVSLNVYFAGWMIDELDAEAVEGYKTWRLSDGIKRVTLRHDLDALSKFFALYAVPRGLTTYNPLKDDVKRPSVPEEESDAMHILSAEEEKKYFKAAHHANLHDTARLILLTGMRPEEVVSLKDTSYKNKGVQIDRGKTKAARRFIPLVDEADAIIRRRIKTSKGKGWLFPSPRKPGRHIVKLNGPHDDVCADTGLNFRLYDFRHTYATRFLEVTPDIPALAALIGHKKWETVRLYAHVQESHKRAAVAKINENLKAATKTATRRKSA